MTRINRRSFLAEMRSLLAFMDADDRAHVLRFYEKLFDQAGEAGEDALLKKLGSPVRQVLQVERLYRDKQKAEEIAGADEAVVDAAEMDVPEAEVAEPEAVEESIVSEEMDFVVPGEEEAVDFSAEEEETVAMEEPAAVEEVAAEEEEIDQPEDTVTEETEEAVEDQPVEEVPYAGVISAETFAEEAEESEIMAEDEEVTEVVPAPGEDEETVEEPEEEPAEEDAPEETAVVEQKPEEKEPVGAGRIVAGVFVTIPVIILAVLGVVLALGLGFAAMGVGVVLGAAGGYLSGYAFGGMTGFLPDILLLTGGMLLCFCLALFFLWLGIWLAVGGIRLTICTVAAIYRRILKRGGRTHG